jgi:hypothetical protein
MQEGLEAGASYSRNGTFRLPSSIVAGESYYVIILSDAPPSFLPFGRVLEVAGGEANNAAATIAPMLIQQPPPSDLVVQTVTGPTNGQPGTTVTVAWTGKNQGESAARGIWADAVYLSTDGVWDYGDIFLGALDGVQRTLAPGDTYNGSLTVELPAILPGEYFILVRADFFDDIFEGSANVNNITASAGRIAIDVPTLTVGTPLTVRLGKTGSVSLVKLVAPAGETLRVSALAAMASAGLELFVRYEGMPSSLRFDAAYTGFIDREQTALVPSTKPGTYYILVRGSGVPVGGVDVRLSAEFVPFGITDVSPDAVGDSRFVTVVIDGAKFAPNALVRLVRPTFDEHAPVSQSFVDATRLVATFDLTAQCADSTMLS